MFTAVLKLVIQHATQTAADTAFTIKAGHTDTGAYTEAVQHNKAVAVHIIKHCAHVNSQIGHRL